MNIFGVGANLSEFSVLSNPWELAPYNVSSLTPRLFSLLVLSRHGLLQQDI